MLDSLLLDQSYIRGWTPSSCDLALFEHFSVGTPPSWQQFPQLSRWFAHIRAIHSDLTRDSCTKVTIAYVASLLSKCQTSEERKVRLECLCCNLDFKILVRNPNVHLLRVYFCHYFPCCCVYILFLTCHFPFVYSLSSSFVKFSPFLLFPTHLYRLIPLPPPPGRRRGIFPTYTSTVFVKNMSYTLVKMVSHLQ